MSISRNKKKVNFSNKNKRSNVNFLLHVFLEYHSEQIFLANLQSSVKLMASICRIPTEQILLEGLKSNVNFMACIVEIPTEANSKVKQLSITVLFTLGRCTAAADHNAGTE